MSAASVVIPAISVVHFICTVFQISYQFPFRTQTDLELEKVLVFLYSLAS